MSDGSCSGPFRFHDDQYLDNYSPLESTEFDLIDVANNEEQAPFTKRKRKKTSGVWEPFRLVKLSDEIKKLKDGTTTPLHRHIGDCPKLKAVNRGQLNLKVLPGKSDSSSMIRNWKFDNTRMREVISHMIMVHELPFNFVEYELFNVVMKEANPRFNKISHASIRQECVSSYEIWKKRIQRLLNTAKRCLKEWNIETKMATLTVDNAKTNDVVAKILMENLNLQNKLVVGGKLFHVRCCAHILNLLVQDGLGEIEDIILNVRESVKHVNASPGRLHIFSELAKQLSMPKKHLILDVTTRRNVAYAMLSTALEFKEVFVNYVDRESTYTTLLSEED
ncbi:hypothetical protein GQ457_12G018630 [Hibiscus cannabinus]